MTNTQSSENEPPGPPHDITAERAVIGACLLGGRDAVERARQANLAGPAFYRPAHETIWEAITHIHDNGGNADPVVLLDAIPPQQHQRIGGAPYLHQLTNEVITTANVGYYATIVVAKHRQRTRWEMATRIRDLATNPAAFDAALREHLHVAQYDTEIPEGGPWSPMNLETIAQALEQGHDPTPKATIGQRRDGHFLLYPQAIHSIAGEPSGGKSWFAAVLIQQEIERGQPVLVIDFEDRAETWFARLRDIGCDPAAIVKHLRYIRPDMGLDERAWPVVKNAATNTTLTILDGVTEAMTLHGLSLTDNEDIAKWLHLLPHRLADLGPAVLQIDHVTKDTENRGRWAIGGQHKLAGITGAAFTLVNTKPLAKGEQGKSKVVVAKDRHGHVGPVGRAVADLHLDARDHHHLHAWLDTPDHTPSGQFRPTGIMERISRYLETTPGPGPGWRDIDDATPGKAATKQAALRNLIAEGYVMTEEGPRRKIHHKTIKPYREDQDTEPPPHDTP